MDVFTLLLQVAFFLLFAVTLVGFARRPSPLTLDVVLMFAALAGLFATQLVGLIVPGAEAIVGFIGLAMLLAQPGLALRLTRHVTRLPRWLGGAMLTAYIVTVLLVGAVGAEQPAVIVVAVAYFVGGNGVAAALLASAARRRYGFARLRLRLAGAAMALLALVILIAAFSPAGEIIARGVTLIAALAFLLAFWPPRWLRGASQQAVAYRFLSDVTTAEAGSGTSRLWQQLADTALSLTGAVGAEVRRTDSDDQEVLAQAGMANGMAPHVRSVEFGIGERRGQLRLRTRGPVLFAEDDLSVLALLGAQTLAAVEREALLAERTAVAERLAAANIELGRASAAKSDFLAAMSHELRTPLNAILGFSELLLTPPAPLDETAIAEYAEHINGAGQHLLELINDILDLSRVEAGRLDLRTEPTDVGRLVTETIGVVRPLAEVKKLSLELDMPASVSAEVDAARLRQIGYNLLSNAIKFTPSGGTVSVGLEADGRTFALSVTDTGPGIASADQERIFGAFEQLTPRSAEGTGLGLALTRRLVEAHGGQMDLNSAPGAGSRFVVRIPLHRPALETGVPVEAEAGSGPLVLIVEDDAPAAELLRLQLGQAGYRAAVAPDGESGLQAAAELQPAAILLDILLPGVDGWEVLRRLRADPATGPIPVMVITIVDNANLGLALGAVDYFVKPVSREVLLEALGRFTLTSKVRERAVTVLAIDDDPGALRLYREALTPEGFTVIAANSGEDGLRLAREGSVDAIVLDLVMPDLDGFEVAARLKDDPATSGIPILVVTAHTLSAEDKERLNRHALAVIAKGGEAMSGLQRWLDQLPVQ